MNINVILIHLFTFFIRHDFSFFIYHRSVIYFSSHRFVIYLSSHCSFIYSSSHRRSFIYFLISHSLSLFSNHCHHLIHLTMIRIKKFLKKSAIKAFKQFALKSIKKSMTKAIIKNVIKNKKKMT